jgi:DNA-binding winged helix-turn-helix (wHTH) protein
MADAALTIHPPQDALVFRTSTVRPKSRLWLRDGKPVVVGGRAFDLLVTLLLDRGRVRTKAEIMAFVWPKSTVIEGALRFQMVALRRALGADADLIKTIPGRGYLFAEDGCSIPRIGQSRPTAYAA